MDNFQIETAQNITIQQNVASLSLRIGAYLIDAIIIGAYIFIFVLLINALDFLSDTEKGITAALFGLPVLLYSLLFEVFMNGQTPGKQVNKIRVTKKDGSKPTFSSYLIRWFMRIIDISLSSGSLAVVTILLNGKGQRLGDLAAGTTVINERKTVNIANTLSVDIPDNYQPTFPQVTVLTDYDVQTIKNLYYKARRQQNFRTILKLHTKILELTGIKTDMQATEFIEVVIKDYNYYTQQM